MVVEKKKAPEREAPGEGIERHAREVFKHLQQADPHIGSDFGKYPDVRAAFIKAELSIAGMLKETGGAEVKTDATSIVKGVIDAVVGSKIPESERAKFTAAALTKLARRLSKVPVAYFDEEAPRVTGSIVGDWASRLDADPSSVLGEVHGLIYPARKTKLGGEARQKELMIDDITKKIGSALLDDDIRKQFMGHSEDGVWKPGYADTEFKVALRALETDVLAHFNVDEENEQGVYYARLHALFIGRGGLGGPAKIIEAVADEPRIPQRLKFAAILVSLNELYLKTLTFTDPQDVKEAANSPYFLGPILARWANAPHELEEEYQKLETCFAIRRAVAQKIELDSARGAFLKEFSVKLFVPALRLLDAETLKQLAGREKGSVGDQYSTYHASLMDSGGFGLPAMVITDVFCAIYENDSHALAVTKALKDLSSRMKEMASSKRILTGSELKQAVASLDLSKEERDEADRHIRGVQRDEAMIVKKQIAKALSSNALNAFSTEVDPTGKLSAGFSNRVAVAEHRIVAEIADAIRKDKAAAKMKLKTGLGLA